MNARTAKPSSHRRYRRRILSWGAVGIVGLAALGSAIFVLRVQDDLEARAVAELESAGVGGVTATFSGQDGELRCLEGAVDIPDDVVESIRDLWGVSSLEVAANCSGDAGGGSDVPTSSDPIDPDPDGQDADATSSTLATTTTTTADLDAVTEIVGNDSQFSTLSGLLGDAGLSEMLAGTGPFTLFAPTDAAFEALGADVTGALARDPELLATVLIHHVADGRLASTDLEDGSIEMLDGTDVTVDTSGGPRLVSGDSVAMFTEVDLEASNGVVHAIDQVLLPVGLVIGPDPVAAQATAELLDGRLVLSGTVADDGQRTLLVAAAQGALDPANVVDELVVDADAVVDDDVIGTFAVVIAAMPPGLVSGTASLNADGIDVEGVAVDTAAISAFEATVADLSDDVTTDLAERPDADAAAAAALEADLNALVAAAPILFEPSSTSISEASAATLDRVAALAERVGGVEIEIQGFTDTDGAAASNQALSEGRARSVRTALVDRGIVEDTLSTVGFGGTRPILDADGNEDKAASRRVEFVVTATQ